LGIWGIITKITSEDISPYMNHLLITTGMIITFPIEARKCKSKTAKTKGIALGLLSGVLAVTWNIAVYKAFGSEGQAAIVIPIANLYPLVTIIVALLVLKEKIHWFHGIDILLAIPAILFLSGETLLFNNPSVFFKNIGLTPWFMFSLVALFFWGIFSAAQKVTTNYISAEWSYSAFIISSAVISILFIITCIRAFFAVIYL
jgi:uncharacterized membrane protein